MSALILMYVYYDNNGDIKAITPTPDVSLANEFSLAMFPVADVEIFLSGKRNPFDFTISKIKKITGETFKLVKKQTEVFLTRTLDNYLTKVEPFNESETILKIITDSPERKIILKLDSAYKELYKTGSEEQQEDIDSFINHGASSLYFTKLNDPYYLYHTVSFVPREVFERDEVVFEYHEGIDLSNSSVYTKKILNSYGYYIRGRKYGV